MKVKTGGKTKFKVRVGTGIRFPGEPERGPNFQPKRKRKK